jgi:hypothetical protein
MALSKPSAGSRWHLAVFERDGFQCRAEHHDRRCNSRPSEAHHIVYKVHLIDATTWLLENGIALSEHCHALAHRTHNANISEARLIAAVDAVNVVQGDDPAFRRPYFCSKGFATL